MNSRVCLGLMVALVFYGCGSKPASPPPAASGPSAMPAPLVDVVPVRAQKLVETVDAVGTLEANEKVSVKPEVAGRITRIGFDEGQVVKKGDILVELDPGKLKQDVEVASAKYFNVRQTVLQGRQQLVAAHARIHLAQAKIEESRQNVRELMARLSRAEAILERSKQDEARTRSLFEKEFKTQDDLEKVVTTVKQAEADLTASQASLSGIGLEESKIDQHPMVRQTLASLEAAKAEEQALLAALGDAADEKSSVDVHPEVRRALAELNLSMERLKDLTLISPMDGILSVRHAAVGDYVDKGTLIFELVDLSIVKTAFGVSERYISRIRIGQAAKVRVAPYPDEVFHGVVYYIDPSADEKSRTVLMKMKIPNSGHRLKDGLFANVQIVVGEYANAKVIPEDAVVPQGGEWFAFAVDHDVAKMKPIKIGLRQSGIVQILEGLEVGEPVVVAGLQKIRDGSPVRVNQP